MTSQIDDKPRIVFSLLPDGPKLAGLVHSSVDVQVGYIDDELACVWGLQPPTLLSDRAYLWLYVTDVVQEHTFTFIRQSQIAVQRMLETYPMLYGRVEVGNIKAIPWLRWLGATFGESIDGRIPFFIRRKG